MTPPRLAIIDTNIVVAALLTKDEGGPTARILEGMLSGRLPFLLSPALLAEYRNVLLRPRLTRFHGLSGAEIDHLLTSLAADSMWREPQIDPATVLPALPDDGDQHLWLLLQCEPASVLVTGDKRLLDTTAYAGRILSPRVWEAPR